MLSQSDYSTTQAIVAHQRDMVNGWGFQVARSRESTARRQSLSEQPADGLGTCRHVGLGSAAGVISTAITWMVVMAQAASCGSTTILTPRAVKRLSKVESFGSLSPLIAA